MWEQPGGVPSAREGVATSNIDVTD